MDVSKVPKDVKSGDELYSAFEDMKRKLIELENKRPYTKRNVEGDASETGLVKFCQPLLMDGKYGCYGSGGLAGLRQTFPIVDGVQNDPAMIPFSSDIKFNLIVRDMNTSQKNPQSKEDNMTVYIKGAPERILNRCKYVLVNEQDRDYD